MAVRPDARKPGSEQFLFVDRVNEAEVMRTSLIAVTNRLRGSRDIGTDGLRNVLVFHGQGGVGKSKLSERLEAWVRHDPLSPTDDWGPPPLPEPVRTARWNFGGSHGQVDVPALLIALRAAVTTETRKWPAFDLALAAYLTATRPGQSIATTTAADQTSDVLSVLQGIAQDLGASNVLTSFTGAAVGRIVSVALKRMNESRQLARFESLAEILRACGRIPLGDDAPDVAADILWLLTEEVEVCRPERRPAVVVFLDHFEKLQDANTTKIEPIINRFIGYLPWVLFVVTGRERLDWDDAARTSLAIAGQARWPLLVPSAHEEPRQHRLGYLSHDETRHLLLWRGRRDGWTVDAELLEKLVTQTDGWPLHIDAVCQVAANRCASGYGSLTEDDLLGNLPDLVRRLYEGLSDQEAHVFNAACLLLYFDVHLAAAVADTTDGAVERCVRRTMIDVNPNARYGLRVNDELRRLVRQVGASVKGGWSDSDWQRAALRGLDEIKARHDRAASEADAAEREGRPRDDAAEIEALVLALTIALEEDVCPAWLFEAIRVAPTIAGLAPRLPVPSDRERETEAGALVRQVRALALPYPDAIPVLEDLWHSAFRSRRSAGLWLAYRLNVVGRDEAAVEQLRALLDDYHEGGERPLPELLHRQIAVQLRDHRHFSAALAYSRAHSGENTEDYRRMEAACREQHGLFDSDGAIFERRASGGESARFRLELRTTGLRRRVFSGEECEADARVWLERSVNLNAHSYQMSCWWVIGVLRLADGERFGEAIEAMRRLTAQYPYTFRITELLALRALLTGRRPDVDGASDSARRAMEAGVPRHAGWIFTEVLMDELGAPLPPVPTDWLMPYADVRRNWLAVADVVLNRATANG